MRINEKIAHQNRLFSNHFTSGFAENSRWLTFQQVEYPKLRAWLCEEFNKAARPTPIMTSYPASRILH